MISRMTCALLLVAATVSLSQVVDVRDAKA